MEYGASSFSRKLFQFFNYSFLLVFSLFTLVPFLLVLAASITDEKEIMTKGYRLFPEHLSLDAYRIILGKGSTVLHAYGVSVTITVIGVCGSMLATCMLAYALAVKEVKYRNKLSAYVFFTMLFSGGIVPWYMVCSQYLGLKDSLLALILPILVSPWNMYLLKNYFSKLPDSIAESAKIDGAGAFTILFRIILPISMPVLATVGLFYSLGYWNDWWLALMLVDTKSLLPLQYLLFKVQSDAVFAASAGSQFASQVSMPKESIKMATLALTIGPIVFVYPFIQRFFVSGITLGSVKG